MTCHLVFSFGKDVPNMLRRKKWFGGKMPSHACMMSDEKTMDDQSLSRRRPDWRGEGFNQFIDRLEDQP